ncbi:mercuric reductase [Microvirga brassicacearum]|uniref:Mercuric reductase n=1 Tax=Microvirga brassicacearum TaxID=2580413 RepID=A0A5N3P774_9HYPH|nr:mercuric reductase [Microvirga brassicacearum]KAB0265580.1 mercuric reductase [Microvirga brassicacearum]
MPETGTVENLILGGGEPGKYIAWELAAQGGRCVVVERALIGGSCPNIACLPSKNVIHSAKVADLLHHAAAYGLPTEPAATDMEGVRERKRAMVEGMVEIHRKKFAADGIEFLLGEGRFVAPRTVEVSLAAGGTRRIVAERIFLNLGTHAALPDVPGLADAALLTAVEVLELDRLPEHLIVLGGGYVGAEFAQAFRRFGSRVTVIEYGPQLIAREDPDVAEAVRAIFAEDGIDVILGAATKAVSGRSGDRVRLQIETPHGERTLEGSDLLVAAGRTPNTHVIGLELAGIECDARGYITVNERLETTAPGIWATGECAGSPQFTHAAFDDFRIVRDNLAGGERTTRGRLVPYCMFVDPELGRVGLSETEARSQNIDVRVVSSPMGSVLRARTLGETRGFMKALLDAHSDRILGFTMLGPNAGEVIAVVQTAMLAGLPFTGLRDAIFTHPTMAEGLNVLFANAPAPRRQGEKS